MRRLLATLLVGAIAAPASAVIIVDGTVDAEYGAPVSIQTVQTEFGDEDGIDDANGGELDAAYLSIQGDRLYIAITGNLETDSFNKLSLFIDSRAGGENTLAVQNYDFNDAGRNLGQVSFAPGFEPDFHLYSRAGGGNFDVDIVDRLDGASSDVLASTGSASLSDPFGTAAGQTDNSLTANGSGVTGSAVVSPVFFALDNSNTAGVAGGTEAADQAAAAAVATGAEFSIALADLGVGPAGMISVVAAYSNGDYNFFSNQFLGGLSAPQGNLGADGAGNFVGDASQTALDLSAVTPFSIRVPEPGTVALTLLASAVAGSIAMRRRLG